MLLIEDDESVAKSLVKAFSTRNLTTEWVVSAAEAYDRLNRGSFSLVLLDLGLPDEDGRALLSEIRARPDTASVPVLVLTGRHSEHVRKECLALGADGFIGKPFELNEMLETVDEVITQPLRPGIRDRPEMWLPLGDDIPADLEERIQYWTEFSGALDVALVVLGMEAAGEDPRRRALPEAALPDVTSSLRETLRDSDELRLLGNSQAVLLLPCTDLVKARRALRRITRRLAATSSPALEEEGLYVVAQGGVALLEPQMRAPEALREARRSQHLSPLHISRPEATVLDEDEDLSALILLVEDDPATLALIRDRLSRAGHRVEVAEDGPKAISYLGANRPDLTILDLELPGVPGFEVLRHIQKAEHLPDHPVIVLTALEQHETATRSFSMGASDYMVKPLSSAELMARVDRLLA